MVSAGDPRVTGGAPSTAKHIGDPDISDAGLCVGDDSSDEIDFVSAASELARRNNGGQLIGASTASGPSLVYGEPQGCGGPNSKLLTTCPNCQHKLLVERVDPPLPGNVRSKLPDLGWIGILTFMAVRIGAALASGGATEAAMFTLTPSSPNQPIY